MQNCGSCHTLQEAGTSGTVGPNLDELTLDHAAVVEQVKNGGGAMPPSRASSRRSRFRTWRRSSSPRRASAPDGALAVGSA